MSQDGRTCDVVFDAVGKLSSDRAKALLRQGRIHLSIRSSTREPAEDLELLVELLEAGEIRPEDWERMLFFDCTQFKKDPPWTLANISQGPTNSWALMLDGHTDYAREDKYKGLFSDTYLYADGQGNAAVQVSAVETILAQKPDVLICTPLGAALKGPLERVWDAGIPVIQMQMPYLTDKFLSYVNADNAFHGRVTAEWLVNKLNGKGKLSEADVREAMREVRMALLEADVNFVVVKDFIKRVTERAVGQEILASLTPGQMVIKIVNEELTGLMGGTGAKLTYASNPPTVYMLCGLQGAGKTTMAGKLAGMLIKQGKKPLLAACDVYRPAAIKQLQVVGAAVGAEVFEKGQGDPVKIAKEAIEHARYYGKDPVIIDTAGRLHIDEKLMQELRDVRGTVKPQEILLVVDAMTGQDAVNVAETFNKELGVDGVILTKLDGDTRGGAAISVKAVTGKPIKFSGIGEKLTDLEPFHPDRMASRILGMGDVMSLIEKAQDSFDEKNAMDLSRKIKTQSFTLEDYLEQMGQIGRAHV